MQNSMSYQTLMSRKDSWLSRTTFLGVTPAILILIMILVLTVFLNINHLDITEAGIPTNFAPAIESMLQSWHNFFYLAAEPSASTSIGITPLGLWIEAVFAWFLGANGYTYAIPNTLTLLASIVIIFHITKRRYDAGAALLAALCMALTPAVSTSLQNNSMDGMLIFCLSLAAWALLEAVDHDKTIYLFLAFSLVGVAFNINMALAYLPLPAFILLYLAAADIKIGKKFRNLSLSLLMMAVISFSWIAIIDLTPATKRPYISGTQYNLMIEKIIGIEGVNTFEEISGIQLRSSNQIKLVNHEEVYGYPNIEANVRLNMSAGIPSNLSSFANASMKDQLSSKNGDAGFPHFFDISFSGQISWLLPFTLISILVLSFTRDGRGVSGKNQMSVVLWGGWLINALLYFCVKPNEQANQLLICVPPMAVLVAAGASHLWRMQRYGFLFPLLILILAIFITLVYQQFITKQFNIANPWLPLTVFAFISCAAFLLTPGTPERLRTAAFICLVLTMLVIPAGWTWLSNDFINPEQLTGQSLPLPFPPRGDTGVNQLNSQSNQYFGYDSNHTQVAFSDSGTSMDKNQTVTENANYGENTPFLSNNK